MSSTPGTGQRLYPILFMFVITVVFIGVVSAIYLLTREDILINESLYLKRAVLYAAGIEPPASRRALEATFQERTQLVSAANGQTAYYTILTAAGQLHGYAILRNGPGLWGEITSVIAFDRDLRRILGIDFIKQNETPGLGARITEEWFKDQFRGKRGPFMLVPEGTASAGNEIDAIASL